MKISAQFATSLDSPEHIETAEEVGYDRAWLFDTPHESPDVWMMLALAAIRTTTIGLERAANPLLAAADEHTFKARLTQFLARRGFDWEAISQAVERLYQEVHR